MKYKNHSVEYIFHSAGYKSHGVKQRIDKGILRNIEGVFYFHIVRHAVSVFFCMVVIYENRYDEHKKYTAMRTIFVLLGLLAASVTVKAQTLTSPDGNFKMQFHLSDEGKPVYSLIYKEKEVIKESKMGFQITPSVFLIIWIQR